MGAKGYANVQDTHNKKKTPQPNHFKGLSILHGSFLLGKVHFINRLKRVRGQILNPIECHVAGRVSCQPTAGRPSAHTVRAAMADLLLDPNIRLWVFLPIIMITFLVGILRHYTSIIIASQKKIELLQVQDR